MWKLLEYAFLGWLVTTIMLGFGSVTVWGEGEASLYIEPSSFVGTAYEPGTDITFYVKVANITGLKSLTFNISYLFEVLGFVEFKIELWENLVSPIMQQGPGYVWFNLSYRTPITTNEPLTLVNVTLLIRDRGETIIDLHDTMLLDIGGAFIPHIAVDGYFNNFNPYDLNRDGSVDVLDVAIVGAAFGSYPGHPRWNPVADVDGDGQVTIIDMALVAEHFGEY